MMLENLTEFKKNIYETNDKEKLRHSIKKCLEEFVETPDKSELALFYYLLNLVTDKDLEIEIKRSKKILDLVRFPLKFQTNEKI
jgi:hypothetical protein